MEVEGKGGPIDSEEEETKLRDSPEPENSTAHPQDTGRTENNQDISHGGHRVDIVQSPTTVGKQTDLSGSTARDETNSVGHVATVLGSGNILVQGGDYSTITVTSHSTEGNTEQLESKIDNVLALLQTRQSVVHCTCHSRDCLCNVQCCSRPYRLPARMPYCGFDHSKSQQYNQTYDYLFKLRHHGRFQDFSYCIESLEGMAGLDPNMQVLINLSRTFSAWVKGASSSDLAKMSSNTDALIRLTDCPVEFDAHKLNAAVLMNLEEGKIVLGVNNSYSAIQAAYYIRPGYLKGFILIGRAYVLSRLVANETCPTARELLTEEGINCCRRAIKNADQEEDLQHLPVTCTNLKGLAYLYMALLYLECSFSDDLVARRRKIPPEKLEGARSAMEKFALLDYAPFAKVVYYIVQSDLKFREGQISERLDCLTEALETAKYAKSLAQCYNFQSAVQYAEYRVRFLEGVTQRDQSMPQSDSEVNS
ncbi:hypothetical protein Bbelb_013840 [Branchiostoma belcheri]|nr:hypothetical protein Bbelb_013840 [Branchiostoma belcheri]